MIVHLIHTNDTISAIFYDYFNKSVAFCSLLSVFSLSNLNYCSLVATFFSTLL